MVVWIVIGVTFFVLGIIILLGKDDKWLIYPGKQINTKRYRIVSGVSNLLCGVWFATNHLVGDSYHVIIEILFWIVLIVTVILQNTWCKKNPDNFSSAKL
ncbi:MAG: hypothetical protein J5651_07800 [Salinivirgaceae bacterium]|nr:hypothetical protein [Salinivirgaceae bacterium]